MLHISSEREGPKADLPGSWAVQEEGFPSARILKRFEAVLLVYFGLRLLFLAATISHYVPPDEVTHLGMSRIFSKFFLFPENSLETYQYGLVTNIPWLYYWIMGKLLPLNIFGVSDLLYLRLINIPLAFGTIYFARRILSLLTDDRLPRILLIVVMTNTLMFSFLSASVSYDNLANLLAAMAVYYLLAFFKERSGSLLALSILCQLAGCLAKLPFLPLVLVLNTLLVIHEARNLRQLPGALAAWIRSTGMRRMGLLLAILLGLALNIQLYGGNYLQYKSLNPEMPVVLSPEIAMQNRLQARNMIFSLFREGRVSREEALAMTARISHPGDREDAVFLVENWDSLKKAGIRLSGPLEYIPLWVVQMTAGIFGIYGHLAMPNYGPTLLPFAVLAVLTCLALPARWRPSEAGWLSASLAVIAGFYGLFLMYYINYGDYLFSGAPGNALQGRYLFPVMGPVYVLSSYYLLRLFSGRHARLGIAAAAALVFIASDFPFFLAHATPEWFGMPPG